VASDPPAPPSAERPLTSYEVFETFTVSGATPDEETIEGLRNHGEWSARSPEDAIWRAVENLDALRTAALSEDPPVMRAASAGKGGLSAAKPYALQQTITRAKP
jgi:hypothetical protein